MLQSRTTPFCTPQMRGWEHYAALASGCCCCCCCLWTPRQHALPSDQATVLWLSAACPFHSMILQQPPQPIPLPDDAWRMSQRCYETEWGAGIWQRKLPGKKMGHVCWVQSMSTMPCLRRRWCLPKTVTSYTCPLVSSSSNW